MHSRWQVTTHHWRRTVILLSVALLLTWNFATIAHQLDLIPEHHSHHHCQLFAGAQHGLVKQLPEIIPPTYQRAAHSDVCLLYTSPSPRDRQKSRMPSSA